MKIVGNTVGTTMPKPNLMQTDPSKGDYVEGKEEFAEQVGGGLSTEQITALDNMFKVCAFTKADVSAEYAAFKTAFGIVEEETHTHSYTSTVTTAATCTTAGVRTYTCSCGESYTEEIPATGHTYVDGVCTVCGAADPDYEEEVTLTSISATYSGGDVAEGTAVTDLTGIVVTAHYSDGTSEAVTGYTLSGTIVPGNNTITVAYQGKTSTFIVVGIAQSVTVTVPYSEWTTEEVLTKKDGTTSAVSGGLRSLILYKEGMRVHTHMNTSWASSFPPIMVLDGGTYRTVECTQDSGFVRHYYATLSGYSADAVVYVNILSGNNIDHYIYYEYES